MHRCTYLTLVVLVILLAGPALDVTAQIDEGPSAAGESFIFSRFEFVGDVVLPVDPLHEAFQSLAGASLSMDDLLALAAVVESYYAERGYPFVLAYYPEQTVEHGVVVMAVIIGRYGRIGLENRSRLKDSVVTKVLRDIEPGAPIYVPLVDEKTKRLQSLPGISAGVVYAAGAEFGRTDVVFEINDAKNWQGGVTVVTGGPPLFREGKLAADVAWLNPFGMADRLDLALSTDGSGTARLEATYEVPVGAEFTYDLRANASWSGYRLTGDWAGLGSGWDGAAGIGLARDWTMATGARLRGDLFAEHRMARDEFLGSVTSHQTTKVTGSATWRPADGQSAAALQPERWAVHVVAGQHSLGTPYQRSLDAATAKTQGLYGVVRAEADWRLSLGRGSTTLRMSGQWAAKNLASAEKFSLAQKVRSNPAGRGTGDDGWAVQIEYSPGSTAAPPLPGVWLATVFVDFGGVTYNKTPWDVTGRGGRWAAGAGLRLDWQPANGLTVRLQQGWTLFDAAGIVVPGDAGPLSLSTMYSF